MRIAQKAARKYLSGTASFGRFQTSLGSKRCLCSRQRGEAHATDRDKVQDKAGNGRQERRTGRGGVCGTEGGAAGRAPLYVAAAGRRYIHSFRRERGR